MAEREVIWLRKADADLQTLYDRFEENEEGRGEIFFKAVDTALARVLLFPESGRPFDLPIRRVLIDDGRFGLFYVPHPTRIVILAIEDLRQDPSRIRRNLGLKG